VYWLLLFRRPYSLVTLRWLSLTAGSRPCFFSCEIYYAVVMLWVIERSFKIERSFRRWGAEPPLVLCCLQYDVFILVATLRTSPLGGETPADEVVD